MKAAKPLGMMNGPVRALALTLLLVSLPACGGSDSSSDPEADQAAPLKLFVFDCGRLHFDSFEAFGIADDEIDIRDVAVPCYMVEHPGGRLLWEGGLPSAVAAGDGSGDQRLDRTLAEQLSDLGLDMSSFDYVVFSHMHYDHIGVANEVAGATWIVQQAEYDAAFADPVGIPGAIPALYENLRSAETLIIDGEHDVFGDGRVWLLPAPGHTPGHQVLFVDLTTLGPLVIAGDLYHFRLSRTDRRVPLFNTDPGQTLQSMDVIEAFVEETGATLWIEHDLTVFEGLRKSPAHYE